MSKKAFDQIMEGMEEALSVARGEAQPFRLHVPAEIDVKAIRTGSVRCFEIDGAKTFAA